MMHYPSKHITDAHRKASDRERDTPLNITHYTEVPHAERGGNSEHSGGLVIKLL